MGKDGKMLHEIDPAGGVFSQIPGKPLRPVFTFGMQKGDRPNTNVMLTCPVSAVPKEVWDLLALWYQCRLTRTMPLAGGFLDQPLMVRRGFPIFEAEMQAWEADHGGPQKAAALAVGAVMAAMGRG